MRTRCEGPSLAAATSCVCASRPAGAARAARAVEGSDPPSPKAWYGRGAVRVFTRSVPPPGGRSPPIIPAGRRFERCFEAAEHPFADRVPRSGGVVPLRPGSIRPASPAIRPDRADHPLLPYIDLHVSGFGLEASGSASTGRSVLTQGEGKAPLLAAPRRHRPGPAPCRARRAGAGSPGSGRGGRIRAGARRAAAPLRRRLGVRVAAPWHGPDRPDGSSRARG